MAFCSKCGAQINDGAKFCPKCGQPTNVVSQQQENQSQQVDDSFGAKIKRFRNSKWNWAAACVLFAAFIGIKTCDTDIDVTDPVDVYNEVASAVTDMEKKGYDDGYQSGFADTFRQLENVDDYSRTSFVMEFGAPKTQEEKELLKTYMENFKKGFIDGMNAR